MTSAASVASDLSAYRDVVGRGSRDTYTSGLPLDAVSVNVSACAASTHANWSL